MGTTTYPNLRVTEQGSIATVTLNRPEVHNAFDAEMIAALTAAFRDLGARSELRAIVVQGAGASFCAGGDLRWMRASLEWTPEENLDDATRLATLYETVNNCSLAVVARVHGAALGGGVGLVAVADIAIAAADTRFGFSEARLGLIPATIAPYVIARIGQGYARSLFLTAERFDAQQAQTMGLVHRVVPAAELDDAVAATVQHLRASGPQAIRAAKRLIADLDGRESAAHIAHTAAAIATIRTSAEAQEGLRAFLEKRRAAWAEEV